MAIMAYIKWLGTNKRYTGERTMDGTWVTYEDAEITDPISGKRVIKQRLSPEFKPVWHDAGIYSYSTVEKRPGYNKDKK